MNVRGISVGFLVTLVVLIGCFTNKNEYTKQEIDVMQYQATSALQEYACHPKVQRYTLANGLTVLICPLQNSSTVAAQMWYKVGTADEISGERGMAHFLEHMIFKGSKKLSETDIGMVTGKLSGHSNAFTWMDYTAYVFDFPKHNWMKILPVFADCMTTCAFKEDHINSEVKAVIQEIKMNKDNYLRFLHRDMLSILYPVHGYHYPTLGYKQDLLAMTHDDLTKFYKKYYMPNNAALVVVGDVDVQKALEEIVAVFGSLPRGKEVARVTQIDEERIVSSVFTMYQDVKQPQCSLAYRVPGAVDVEPYCAHVLADVLTEGKSSRLYKKLIEQEKLVSNVSALPWDLKLKGMLFVDYTPFDMAKNQKIVDIIQQEFDDIALNGLSAEELQRVQKSYALAQQKKLEQPYDLAYEIGKAFVYTNNEQYPFTAGIMLSDSALIDSVKHLAGRYCKSSLCLQGRILPLDENDKKLHTKLQKESDEQDTKIMDLKVRTSPVEPVQYACFLVPNERQDRSYPQPTQFRLANGLDVCMLPTENVDLVTCKLTWQATSSYVPDNKLGLSGITADLLLEGTKKHPGQSFVQYAEQQGIYLKSSMSSVGYSSLDATWLAADNKIGFELLAEILTAPEFSKKAFDKKMQQTFTQRKVYWDTPGDYEFTLADEYIYKNHPWGRVTTKKDLESITLADVKKWHAQKISPRGACLFIVGKFDVKEMKTLLEQTITAWQAPVVEEITFPPVQPLSAYKELHYYANKDQTYIHFSGLSVKRTDADYLPLQLFQQIFSHGFKSRLFLLREQTGLFYLIQGRLACGAFDEPGVFYIRSVVSNDKLEESKKIILDAIDHAIDSFTDEELQEAKNILYNSYDAAYDTNAGIIGVLEKCYFLKQPYDMYQKEIERIKVITKDQVVAAVKKYIGKDKLVLIQIGRTGTLEVPKE